MTLEHDIIRKNAVKENFCSDIVMDFINELRTENIHLLSKGSIEAYYPSGITGSDKVSRAFSACELVKTRDDALKLSPECEINGEAKTEFEWIFSSIFELDR